MYVCGDDVIAYVHCIIVNMGHNIIMSKIINGYHTKHACGHYKDLYYFLEHFDKFTAQDACFLVAYG